MAAHNAASAASHADGEQAARRDYQNRLAKVIRDGGHSYANIRIVTDADVRAHVSGRHGCRNGGPFDLICDNDANCVVLRFRRSTPFESFALAVAGATGVPPRQQAFWFFSRRENGTLRPAGSLRDDVHAHTIRRICAGVTTTTVPLYLMRPHVHVLSRTSETLLFFKLYDAEAHTLSYVGRAFVASSTRIEELGGVLLMDCRVRLTNPQYFEEVKSEPDALVDALEPGATLEMLELEYVLSAHTHALYSCKSQRLFFRRHGDIVIVQECPSITEVATQVFAFAPTWMASVLRAR